MKHCSQILIVLLVLLGATETMACLPVPVPENSETYDDLIDRAEAIYLAKAIAAKQIKMLEQPETLPPVSDDPLDYRNAIIRYKDPEKAKQFRGELSSYKPLTYKFEVMETIKGQDKKNFSLKSHRLHSERQLNDFDNHNEKEFWLEGKGRSTREGSCSQDPSFSVGVRYLVFISDKMHPKSYERISDRNKDKWLSYVRGRVNGTR